MCVLEKSKELIKTYNLLFVIYFIIMIIVVIGISRFYSEKFD